MRGRGAIVDLHYTAEEASKYTRSMIEYCERMMGMYEGASHLSSLRAKAEAFAALVRADPIDLTAVIDLHRSMKARSHLEGTGWIELTRYIGNFVERWGRS